MHITLGFTYHRYNWYETEYEIYRQSRKKRYELYEISSEGNDTSYKYTQ